MNEILQPSQLLAFDDSNTTCLPKRIYTASQGIVDDLQAHVASLYATIMPEDLYAVMLLAEESFRTVTPLHVEYRIQNSNSSQSWLKAAFMPEMQDGSILEWHGFITETTKSKHVEHVLEHLYKALDSLTDPVFVKDRLHRWIFLNDACCQMIGLPREALIGKTDFDFFLEQEAKAFWDKDEVVFSSGQESISEETLTDSKGRKQAILSKKTRYTDSHWQHYIVGIISNITERKQAELEKQKFLTILEESVDFVGSVDMQGHLQYRNRAALRMVGLPDDADISAMNFTEMYPASVVELLQQVIIPTALAQGAWRGETTLLHRDGREVPVSQLVVVHKGADGQPEFISTVMQDITERKKVEALLASSERVFRTMIENAPDNIVRYDRDLRILYANPTMEKTIGRPASALIGRRADELVPNNSGTARYLEVMQQVLDTGQALEYLMIAESDGYSRSAYDSIKFTPEFAADGTVQGVIAVGRDFSSTRQLEKEIAERERELGSLINNMPDSIVRYDRNLRILYVNPIAEMTLGRPASELIGNRPDELFPTQVTYEFQQVLQRVLETGQVDEYLMVSNLEGLGRPLYDSIRVAPEIAADGSVQGIITIGRDLSSVRQLEVKIAERERELHTLIDNMPDVIIRYDLDCRRTWISENYERVYGNPMSVAFGKKPTESWGKPRMKPDAYEDLLLEVMVNGEPLDIELDWITVDGEYVCQSLRVVPEYDAKGAICSALSFTRDVSTLKRAELHLETTRTQLTAVLQTIPDMVWMKSVDGAYLTCNPAFEPLIGAKEADIIGKTDLDLLHVGTAMLCKQTDMEAIAANTVCISEEWLTFADNQRQALFEARKVPVHAADGSVIGVLGIGRDITERRQIEMALKASEHELRSLIEHSPEIIIRYDVECRRVFVSPAHERITGIPTADALSNTLADTWMAENISSEDYKLLLQEVVDSGEPTNVILEWVSCDDALVSMDMRVVPEYDVEGRIIGTLVFGHDISRLRSAEMELIKREQEFRVLVENSPDTINRYDRHCRRIYANPRMQIDSGVPLDELLNKTPGEFPGGEQAHDYQQKILKVINTGIAGQFELTWPTPSGKEMCSHIHLTPEFDVTGNVMSVLAVGRNITEIDQYRKQIQHLAYFDPLTHLPNRLQLNDLVSQSVDDATSRGRPFGLLVMDLDRFKEINDTLGHSVGDKVLCEAAYRLQSCVRSNDILARLGGDEFAIFQPEIDSNLDLEVIACQIIIAFNRPFMIDGRELFITTSIGIAIYPNHSQDVESLFRYADSAMYHAKKLGRNNYQFYSASLSEKAAERMSMESDLRKAQERNELELYYQPQVALVTGEIIGAEALLRWKHGKKGMIAPDKFIPIAEETGLIIGVGEWVLHSACQAAVAWNTGRETPLCIAVNLSTRQFIRNDLVATVQRILQETACDPGWIKLEITESLLLEDSTAIATMLDTFNNMGHAISIDDFGTGYSALSYLNRFPVSQIKIDRSFVKDIPNNHEKTELVKVMISIAQVLKMELVAEGVETKEQADCLLSNNCPIVQGYLFGKPMPYAAFEALIL